MENDSCRTQDELASPEVALLRACAATFMEGGESERIRAVIRRGVDWPRAIRMAAAHSMTPIVYRALSSCTEDVPADVIAHLRRRIGAIRVRNTYLTNEMIRIVGMFAAAGIDVVAFKGPLLAALAYGDVGMREFSDIDLLIHQPDLAAATNILTSQDYRPLCPNREVLESAIFHFTENPFLRDDGFGSIDLHWRMTPRYFPFGPDGDAVWQRKIRAELAGGSVNTLCLNDLLLFLCVHGAKHGWRTFGWVCDIGALIARYPASEWPSMLEDARSLQSRRFLLIAAFLAHELTGVALPEPMMAAVYGDRSVIALGAETAQRMFRNGGARSFFHEWVAPLRSIESVGLRARYLGRRAFSPTIEDWNLIRLPKALSPLYFLIRPIRLSVMQGPRLVRALIGHQADASPATGPSEEFAPGHSAP